VCGLAANRCDRDMPHRGICLGAMPMALAGLDMHDIADIDLALLVLVRHHAGARGHDQHLLELIWEHVTRPEYTVRFKWNAGDMPPNISKNFSPV
jgi:hypothetical protein